LPEQFPPAAEVGRRLRGDHIARARLTAGEFDDMRASRPTTVCHRPCALALLCLSLACAFRDADPPLLTAEMPLHLEAHLDAAQVTGSKPPADAPRIVEWRFDQPQPDWKPLSWNPTIASAALQQTGEALRVTLTEQARFANGIPAAGGMYIELPSWHRGEWSHVVVRARSSGAVNRIGLRYNLRPGRGGPTDSPLRAPIRAVVDGPLQQVGQSMPVVRDGTIQTYRLGFDVSGSARQDTIRQLGLWFFTGGEAGSIEILSIAVEPTGLAFRDEPFGSRMVSIANRYRRTLYTHAPARIAYRIRLPQQARLSTALGVLQDAAPVTFRVRVQPDRDTAVTVLEEQYSDPEKWAQRTVDLSRFAGQSVTLVLESEAQDSGTIAFWSAPTVSGARSTDRPNVIFYVIDGGAADQMSLYGYNRRTTPNLEALVREGALFEQAYSNAAWSKPSTTSFMTSLQHSVLGNVKGQFDPLPVEARTMAERFHDGGYQTAVFVSNPWAGSMSSLERNVDVFRDDGVDPPSRSTIELHNDYWDWREAYPGQPYWVHFQTTDVHGPRQPVAPFAGLFAPPEATKQKTRWDSTLAQWSQRSQPRFRARQATWRDGWPETGIDRIAYYDVQRAIFDETMAHQDYQIGRFVERLKQTGEWENTLLVIGADHSLDAINSDFNLRMQDSIPPDWQSPIFRSSVSRVPLIFIWPGHIRGGQRFRQAVSNIDVLPTVLELAGLPQPEVLQGQSLAPLLLGRDGWRPRPVIFDEFNTDGLTGKLAGRIEVLDGRWGASLWIGPPRDTLNHRPTPLLLFDVQNDPLALKLMNAERPDLVKKYTEFLEKQWEAHQLLAKRFTPGGKVELTPEQIETLRALGYIR
jgi:arylsulfatase A-like enzyme